MNVHNQSLEALTTRSKLKSSEMASGVPELLLKLFPLLGLVAGFIMWLADAAIDVYIFNPDEAYWESVFSADDTELWMRSLNTLIMLISAIFAQHLLLKEKKIEHQLK